MAQYQYQGVDRTGKKVQGDLEAPHEGEVRMVLRGQGVRPTKITKKGTLNSDIGSLLRGGQSSVRAELIVNFTRQLQVLISSGIPLIQGLEILSDQALDGTLKNILTAVRERVSQGSYFWEALSLYPKTFPKLYIALIRAGEASGSLEQMLKRLTRYIEDSERLKRMVKGAMTYPVMVILIGMTVMGLLLVFVIPKFEEMLKANQQALPAPTQFVLQLSNFFIHNIVSIVLFIGGFIFLAVRYYQSSEGRAVVDRFLFHAPLFGVLIQKSNVARFARTMQTLLSSGVNLLDAIDICKSTVESIVLEEAIGKIRVEVEAGKTLGSTLDRLKIFPKMAVQMISIGESTGNLDKMLEKVADFFETETEAMIQNMTKLIEPLVIVFLAVMVGGMMIAMYLPVFKIAGGGD